MIPAYARGRSPYLLQHPQAPVYAALLQAWPEKIQRVACDAAQFAFERGAEVRRDGIGRIQFARSAEARGLNAARAVLSRPWMQRAARANFDATEETITGIAGVMAGRVSDVTARRAGRAEVVASGVSDRLREAVTGVPPEYHKLVQAMAAARAILAAGVTPPKTENQDAYIARAKCQQWWRRALRKQTQQAADQLSRHLGEIHRGGQLYCADATLERRRQQKKRNDATLADITMECVEDGHRATLAELAAVGVGNPQIRRNELMTRLSGLEEWATAAGLAADFWTLTCPSEFHAFSDGKRNRRWNESTPREASDYLCKVWARARASLRRAEIAAVGLRVCEPHHDGTPHWHLLVFLDPERRDEARAIVRRYALEMCGKEKGARKYRFNAVRIDPSRGSAVGYVAKYISKNIDGHAVGDSDEAPDSGVGGADAAERVEAWASAWRIRQFQFFGLSHAPVTLWREMRRMPDLSEIDMGLESLRLAADVGDYAAFIDQQCRALAVLICEAAEGENRYGEERAPEPFAVCSADGVLVPVQRKTWRVVGAVGGAAAPWTGGNNCTRVSVEGRKNGGRGREKNAFNAGAGAFRSSG